MFVEGKWIKSAQKFYCGSLKADGCFTEEVWPELPRNASRFLEGVACGRRRTADVRLFKSSSVIIWSAPKGAELHVPTKHNFFSRVTKLPWEKNMRSGFDAWRIFLIYEKTGGSWAWSEIECGSTQTIYWWIALVPGSNFTKKPKPQVHLFFVRDHQTCEKWAFLRFFGVFSL